MRTLEARLVCATAATRGSGLRHGHAANHVNVGRSEVCAHCGVVIFWDRTHRLWSQFLIYEEPW